MPGTIHVSVLHFSDLPSTSSSSVLFKVSMGKREHQTLDKGDFSFPVKSLREKLILAVLDDLGSKMCQTVVEAILVVQKGQWDDYFSLDGGGRVRMRLQFVLSDEDRVKIRKMRESALQKKHNQLLITHPELSKTISLYVGVRNSDIAVDILNNPNDGIEDAKTSPVCDTVSLSNTQLSVNDENAGGDAVNKKRSDRDRTQEAVPLSAASDAATVRSAEVNTSALVKNQEADKQYTDKSPGALNFKLGTFSSKGKLFTPNVDDPDGTTIKEEKLRKTPSSVRKMISTFECNTTPETKPRNKPPPLKTPINKLVFVNPSHDLIADEVIIGAATKKLTEMSSEIVVSPSFFSELRQKVSAKKRQISYDVVEIITIAPERGLAEASAGEFVTKPPETSVSAFDEVDRFEVTPVDMRIGNMTSREDDTRVPTVETVDNVELKDKELENKDMQFFDDSMAIEKDSINRPLGDSDTISGEPPQDQMRNLNDETENSISAEDTLLQIETKDDSGLENDRAAAVYGKSLDDTCSAKQLVFDDMHSDIRNSGGRIIRVVSEKKPPSEVKQHVNKGTMSSKKLDNTKSLIEWSPTSEPPSSWVFPDEPRASCIAPSSIQMTNSICGSKVEANFNALENNMHSARKPCQERKPVNEPSKSPGTNGSDGDGIPKRQLAQAIKIAIMVAFGALVFFSRQRNHR